MDQTFSEWKHLLDARILRALADLGFARPTLVQQKAIPIALNEGKDILARARTGSGKTAAYCIPIVQRILGVQESTSQRATRALILVPTRELSEQVSAHLRKLLAYCENAVTFCNVASNTAAHVQRMALDDTPDIIVATPSRALSLLQSKSMSLSALQSLVIDEADLVLSFGHEEDVQQIMSGSFLPKVYQSYLMSATMTKDVETLKGLVLRSPAILTLEEDEDQSKYLSQYFVRCSEADKFLVTYVILKLKLIKGKCLLFVNDLDRCYRLKLFLEQFSIKSCVLNAELPLNSRFHIVQEFNKGVYDYIIATDEANDMIREPAKKSGEEENEEAEPDETLLSTDRGEPTEDTTADELTEPKPSKKRKRGSERPAKKWSKHHKKDKEFGVARGIDFVNVACVINFDLPTSATAYTHRIGRTARARSTGMAFSYVLPREQYGKNKVVGGVESTMKDEEIWKSVEEDQGAKGSSVKEYKFDRAQLEAFRYRMEDALRAVTRHAIKEARVKELKSEILNSEKLKAHFEDNPLDLEYLRHDKPLHPTRVQTHMKFVPKYLLKSAPLQRDALSTDNGAEATSDSVNGFVPFKASRNRGAASRGRGGRGRGRGGNVKKGDPLRKFGR